MSFEKSNAKAAPHAPPMWAFYSTESNERDRGTQTDLNLEAEVGIEPACTALQAVALLSNTMRYAHCHPQCHPIEARLRAAGFR